MIINDAKLTSFRA